MTVKVYLDGVELVDDVQFFDGFNWGNFFAGDKVYVEDFDNARVDQMVYVFFDGLTDGAGGLSAWLRLPEVKR